MSSRILINSTGGWGGFFASVRDMGVTGQQQQASKVSADDATRGGAGGFFWIISRGGATNPASPVPSPEISVPVQSVVARAALITFLVAVFIFKNATNDCARMRNKGGTRCNLLVQSWTGLLRLNPSKNLGPAENRSVARIPSRVVFP